MTLKKPKAKGGKKSDKKKQQQKEVVEKWVQDVDSDEDDYAEDGQIVCLIFYLISIITYQFSPQASPAPTKIPTNFQQISAQAPENKTDPDDPLLTTPLPRYNTMLAVLRNTLYM